MICLSCFFSMLGTVLWKAPVMTSLDGMSDTTGKYPLQNYTFYHSHALSAPQLCHWILIFCETLLESLALQWKCPLLQEVAQGMRFCRFGLQVIFAQKEFEKKHKSSTLLLQDCYNSWVLRWFEIIGWPSEAPPVGLSCTHIFSNLELTCHMKVEKKILHIRDAIVAD